MPTKSPDMELVTAALARLLRRGLPVTRSVTDPVLLGLRGVLARAVDSSDEASRISALDGLLRGLLARFPDARYAGAARALFGLPPAEPGRNLTTRREVAARLAEHEVHHFRKRVEPRLIEQMATLLMLDADRFTRSRWVAPRLAPSAERQPVSKDPFAWEVAEHEEVLCRVWSAIYALRAELLGIERLISLGADQNQMIRQAVTAAWRWGLASTEATGYVAAFGTDDRNGGVSAQELVAIAGWTPTLSAEQQSRLAEAVAGNADREGFVSALHDEIELSRAWAEAFVPCPARGSSDTNSIDTERQSL